ncbi:MAG: fused MFS/spermidine synthase [Gemmataceae bacterium]
MPLLFALTLFVAAALLFLVEPLVGKLLLPALGGTPAVWNTCLVFFNVALLAGYLYAHGTSRRLPAARQARWHLLVLLAPVTALAAGWWLAGSPLPVLTGLLPTDHDYPMLPLLGLLAVAVGLPFAALATTSPLLMRWFAAAGGPAGRDPYYLYAASNAGSLLGLLAYPLLVEPALPLHRQQTWWAVAAAAEFALIGLCAVVVARWAPSSAVEPTMADTPASVEPIAPRRMLRWLGLAALPAALLMAVTSHLTTDLAPVPLLWVLPLALYLISFIVVFAWWPERVQRALGRVTPMLLLFLVVLFVSNAAEPVVLVVTLHLGVFVAVTFLCHGALALDRPASEHLTAFYLTLSLGGVVGGLACAIVAPVAFARLGLLEYPVAVVLGALVRPGTGIDRPRWSDFLLPLGLAGLTVALAWGGDAFFGPVADDPTQAATDRLIRGAVTFGLPTVLAYCLVNRPLRYALALAVLIAATPLERRQHGQVLLTERNFFGTLRVTRTLDGRFVRLVHGTTQHGQQRTDEDGPPTPLMYYHPTTPVGRALRALPDQRLQRVGLVGLGCGALAAYARPGQHWTFFEIDPAVARIAADERYFTYLKECRGEVDVVLGDARRRLHEVPDGSLNALVLDAFSSDAIPVHLLTREAFELYLRKLTPDGVLLLHLSNRYLDLPPLVARIAASFDPPLIARTETDYPSPREAEEGKFASTWTAVARRPADLAGVAVPPRWQPERTPARVLWTDQFSNLLGAWRQPD